MAQNVGDGGKHPLVVVLGENHVTTISRIIVNIASFFICWTSPSSASLHIAWMINIFSIAAVLAKSVKCTTTL